MSDKRDSNLFQYFLLFGVVAMAVLKYGRNFTGPASSLWETFSQIVGPAIPADTSQLAVAVTAIIIGLMLGVCIAAILAPVVYAFASRDKFALLFCVVALGVALYKVTTSSDSIDLIVAALVYLIATVVALGAFALRAITKAVQNVRTPAA
jgi:hypothetical protein